MELRTCKFCGTEYTMDEDKCPGCGRGEENQEQKQSFIKLLQLTRNVLETAIDLLGFAAPERM